jgi:hypothetical protein
MFPIRNYLSLPFVKIWTNTMNYFIDFDTLLKLTFDKIKVVNEAN